MNFLNRSYDQAMDLLRSMTVGARVAAGLLIVMVVTSLLYLFMFEINGGNDYLFGAREFSQAELDAMQKAFADAGLDQFDVVGYRIRVPRRNRYQYLQALTQSNFTPENFDSAIDEALSGSSSWFESKELRDLKLEHAVEKKLARVISAIAGIENATVQYHQEHLGGFPPRTEKSATIAVAAAGRRPLDSDLVNAVRMTASNWFGIPAENTLVTDLIRGRAYAGKGGINDNGAAESVYADTKQHFEQIWRGNILQRLVMYPGIVVAVNVELDPELKSETQKVTIDPQGTAVESNSLTKSSESRPNAAGRPGAVPNQVSSNTPRTITTPSSTAETSEETRENQVSLAGHEQTLTTKAPLPPKSVTASIGVPKSLYAKMWQQRNPTPAGQQPKQPTQAEIDDIEKKTISEIEAAIVNLVPPPSPGVNPYPNVQVTSYDDLPPDSIEPPSSTSVALSWLGDNWQTLALIGLGAFGLIFLRSMIRTALASQGTTTAAAPAPAKLAVSDGESESEVAEPQLPRHRDTGKSNLRSELTTLVKDDPDAAANVLRTWIGEVA